MTEAVARAETIAVVGAGTMGTGIAQVAAMAGHTVLLHSRRAESVAQAIERIAAALAALVAKGRLGADERGAALARLRPAADVAALAPASLVVESIAEDLEAKRALFAALEAAVAPAAILATNTSALSIGALARGLRHPARLVGMHFFNPAPVMALVEVVSGLATSPAIAARVFATARAWGKTPVHARSTPGFIVNRCARPFYTEAWRLLAETRLDPATLDALLREAGGFRMGPCELMDLIGHDVNYATTRGIHEAFHGEPRHRPSHLQRELVESGRLGRKTGHGLYDHAAKPAPRPGLTGPRPQRLRVAGALGAAEALAARAVAAGITVERGGPEAGEPGLAVGRAMLRPTDGRMATRRLADSGRAENLVLFDLAMDYASVPRLAVAAAAQAEPGALDDAAGVLAAIGVAATPVEDVPGLVVLRTIAMLVNEAMDAAQEGVAEAAAIDVAMMKGVGYPRGPFAWAEAVGIAALATAVANIADAYGEDRWRVSPRLQRQALCEPAARRPTAA